MLSGMVSPNSATIDDDGFVYTTDFDQIRQVDPNTGVYKLMLDLPGMDLDGLTFSPDFEILYFNYDSGGVIGYLEVQGFGDAGDNGILADATGGWGGELNGMAVDKCGNIYAVQTSGTVFRVFPDGQMETFMEITGGVNTTSLHFGSGFGGWEEDHLYIMDRTTGIIDVDVGIEGKWEPQWPPREVDTGGP